MKDSHCEQAGYRKRLSAIGDEYAVAKFIEASRKHKYRLVSRSSVKKASDAVEMMRSWRTLDKQGVHAQFIRSFRELYSYLATKIATAMTLPSRERLD